MSKSDQSRQDLAEGLAGTFPGASDAPLAVALVRLLSAGTPVSVAALTAATGRPSRDIAAQLNEWPNVERDEHASVVAFAGLTLRPTAHAFEVDGRTLHTWCAWDTLFLPAMLGATALVSSNCPITGTAIELVVAPERVERSHPDGLHVSFPPSAATDTANITASFCCHVHFLAGDRAATAWRDAHPDGEVLTLQDAFALGSEATAPLADPQPHRTAVRLLARVLLPAQRRRPSSPLVPAARSTQVGTTGPQAHS